MAITNREMFEVLKNLMTTGELSEDVTAEEVVEFCDKQIAALDHKAEKAKERAAAKRAESDELTNAIAAVLTDELQTIAEITKAVGREDVSVNKVQARLSKLAAAEVAVKDTIMVEGKDGKKASRVAYKLA